MRWLAKALLLLGLGNEVAHGEDYSPAKEDKKPKVSGSVSTTLTTDYVSKQGFVNGSGPASQSYLGINLGKGLTAFTWLNYDLTDDELSEVDVGVSYAKSGLFGLKGLSGSVNLQKWMYPSERFSSIKGEKGEPDYVGEVSASYSDPDNPSSAKVDLTLTHHLTDPGNFIHNRIHGKLSKPIPLIASRRGSFSLVPEISSAWNHEHYGLNGFSQVTPGVGLRWKNGNVSVTVEGKRQISLDNKIEDNTRCMVTAGYDF